VGYPIEYPLPDPYGRPHICIVFDFGKASELDLGIADATLALGACGNPVLVAFRLGHTSTRMLEPATMPEGSVARTANSRALLTLRHVCGTPRDLLRAREMQAPPDLRFRW
jgi:hypothetical protein